MGLRIRKPDRLIHAKGGLTPVRVGRDGSLDEWRREIDGYWDVLLGRVPPPIDKGVHTLQEVAVAYYARAKEIHAQIKESEADGRLDRHDRAYKFRTGALRDFIEVASKAADLGSRRVTVAQLAAEMRIDAADLDTPAFPAADPE